MELQEKQTEKGLWGLPLSLWEGLVFVGFFLAAWLICRQVPYSNGDDVYFGEMAHTMSLPAYLKMRYITWEGRMTSEAMTYVAFRLGHTFWSWMNALVLTLLPAGLIRIVQKITAPQGSQRFFVTLQTCFGITLLGVAVLGYGAIWITGSTFYLWSIVAGIWAAMPFVDLAFTGSYEKKTLLYSIPCGFIAGMGLEQITAVVLVFGVLALVYYLGHSGAWGTCLPLVAQLVIMAAALLILFLSPGTSARSQSEILTWMPEFETMSLGNHIFITVQWMLESLAKDGKLLLAALWCCSAVLLWRQGGRSRKIQAVVSLIAAVAACLPLVSVNVLTDLGTGVTDITQCVEQVATPSSLTGTQWLAMIFWTGLVVWMLWLSWSLGETILEKCFYVLLVLAALASDAILFFSPTMYASGARIHFMAEILLWLLVSLLAEKLTRNRRGFLGLVPAGLILAAGIANVATQMMMILGYF